MTFRIGFVTGATPDKWARTWRDRSHERLELVPVEEATQTDGVRTGDLDMALVRLPVDRDGLHLIPLYEERVVVVAGIQHVVAAADEVELADLADDQLVAAHQSGWTPTAPQLDWPVMSTADAVAAVAAGTGIVLVPQSVARLHARKDVVTRQVTDLEPTTVALCWRRPGVGEEEDPRTQTFVGIVRGRTARSSRS